MDPYLTALTKMTQSELKTNVRSETIKLLEKKHRKKAY